MLARGAEQCKNSRIAVTKVFCSTDVSLQCKKVQEKGSNISVFFSPLSVTKNSVLGILFFTYLFLRKLFSETSEKTLCNEEILAACDNVGVKFALLLSDVNFMDELVILM